MVLEANLDVTGKSLRSLVQISKGYDSYLDERGRGTELRS